MPKKDQLQEGRDRVLRSTDETIASRHPEGQAVVDALQEEAKQAQYEADLARDKHEEEVRKAEKQREEEGRVEGGGKGMSETSGKGATQDEQTN